jgi:hypothetical protein
MNVTVEFSNGTVTFSEMVTIRYANDLDSFIKSRIKQAMDLEALNTTLATGAYAVTIEPDPVATPLDEARLVLERYQKLVNLGIMTNTDPEYVAALNAAKAAYSSK